MTSGDLVVSHQLDMRHALFSSFALIVTPGSVRPTSLTHYMTMNSCSPEDDSYRPGCIIEFTLLYYAIAAHLSIGLLELEEHTHTHTHTHYGD